MGHEHVVRPIVQCCQRQQKYITGSGHAKKACVQPSCTPLPAAPPLLPWGIKPDTSPFLPAWKSCQQQIWVGFCGHLEGGEGPSGGSGSQEAMRGLALGGHFLGTGSGFSVGILTPGYSTSSGCVHQVEKSFTCHSHRDNPWP